MAAPGASSSSGNHTARLRFTRRPSRDSGQPSARSASRASVRYCFGGDPAALTTRHQGTRPRRRTAVRRVAVRARRATVVVRDEVRVPVPRPGHDAPHLARPAAAELLADDLGDQPVGHRAAGRDAPDDVEHRGGVLLDIGELGSGRRVGHGRDRRRGHRQVPPSAVFHLPAGGRSTHGTSSDCPARRLPLAHADQGRPAARDRAGHVGVPVRPRPRRHRRHAVAPDLGARDRDRGRGLRRPGGAARVLPVPPVPCARRRAADCRPDLGGRASAAPPPRPADGDDRPAPGALRRARRGAQRPVRRRGADLRPVRLRQRCRRPPPGDPARRRPAGRAGRGAAHDPASRSPPARSTASWSTACTARPAPPPRAYRGSTGRAGSPARPRSCRPSSGTTPRSTARGASPGASWSSSSTANRAAT